MYLNKYTKHDFKQNSICIEFFGFPNGNLQYNHAIVADISRKWKIWIGGLDKKGSVKIKKKDGHSSYIESFKY